MDKKTKMLLGIGLLGVVGYMVWKQQSKPKAGFANLTAGDFVNACCGHTSQDANGYTCCNGTKAMSSLGLACGSEAMKNCAAGKKVPVE